MAKYEMQELNIPSEEDGRRILYPRLVLEGQDGLDELTERMCRYTTFAPAEVKGIVQLLAEAMADSMARGRSVKIEGLGIFTPRLGVRKGFEPETGLPGSTRRNATAIRVDGVRFKPDKELVRDIDQACRLERSERKFRQSSRRYTPQQRLALAQDYLSTHPYLTVSLYERLTGLLHVAASRELRQWARQEGTGILASGMGSHRVYVRQEE